MNILTRWGEYTRNKTKMRTTKWSNLTIWLMFAALLVTPAYTPVAGWQMLASFTFIAMLSLYWMRTDYNSWSKQNEKPSV